MSTSGQTTVLIVEDEAPIALMQRKALTASGFAVEEINNGAAALARLEQPGVDLVLLDYRLPDMTGAEILETLGERLEVLPVIMLTAYGSEKLVARALKAGAADYVAKDGDLRFIHDLPKIARSAIDRFALAAENRRLQSHLRESEERAQLALDGADLGSWDLNVKTGDLTFNQRWAEMLGWAPDEVELHLSTWHDLVHPDDRLGVEELLNAHLGGKTDSYETEHRLQHRSGEWVWVLGKGRVIRRTADGKPLRACGTYLDISERKQTEEELERNHEHLEEQVEARTAELRESEERRRLAQSVGHVGIWDWNLVTDELIWSDETYRILGFSPGEVTPSLEVFFDRVHGDDRDRLDRAVDQARQLHQPLHIDYRVVRQDGSELMVNSQGKVELDADDRPLRMLGTFQDITERKQAEAQIVASLREKEVLLREIHHRVKNNMQVIISLLRLQAGRSQGTQAWETFEGCRDRISAMSLVHEAIYKSDDLSRIDFSAYLTQLCHNLRQAYGGSAKGATVTVGQCDVELGIDKSMAVGMVVCELVSNAFKHAFPNREGGSVAVSMSGETGRTELIVEDDGIGLPPEIDIHNPPSLGLELVTRAVTHQLGGSIEVGRNEGTRFVIQLGPGCAGSY